MVRSSLLGLQAFLLSAAGIAPAACGGKDSEESTPSVCDDPSPFPFEGTGYEKCATRGFVHRPFVAECPSTLPSGGAVCDGVTCPGPHGFCGTDACIGGSICKNGCITDDECGPGQVCLCDTNIGQCKPAECKSDADCGGRFCIGSGSGIWPDSFHCQTEADTCAGSVDCSGDAAFSSVECIWDGTRHKCMQGPVCGRPFLVGGALRTAEIVRGPGWSAPLDIDVDGIEPEDRALLRDHYLELAKMEHASVAAFARFALELLALGAPADMLEATHVALGDEVQHARVCFGLASAYAGEALGPGPLPLADALAEPNLVSVARAAIHEACIGETLASVDAAASAERATVPSIRAIWQRIAADEARHAALGWRFLTWALQRVSSSEREMLLAELTAECDQDARSSERTNAIPEHGMLALDERRALQRAALREVVLPLATRLGARHHRGADRRGSHATAQSGRNQELLRLR